PALRRSCRPSTALYPAHLGYDAPPLWRRPARLSTLADRIRARLVCMLLAALAVSGCVYQMDIQQGNLLEEETIAQVEVGMTRSQVQFLLGTPTIADAFHRDRWD